MVYLTLTAMFVLVLWPALLPLTIHGSHTIANWRQKPSPSDRLALADAS